MHACKMHLKSLCSHRTEFNVATGDAKFYDNSINELRFNGPSQGDPASFFMSSCMGFIT